MISFQGVHLIININIGPPRMNTELIVFQTRVSGGKGYSLRESTQNQDENISLPFFVWRIIGIPGLNGCGEGVSTNWRV